MRIGLDFDNTIAKYDQAFLVAGQKFGYLSTSFVGPKQDIRDFLRNLSAGETKWMRLQGYVYGKGINKAELFEGLPDFLTHCRDHNTNISIVSHKTEFGHMDKTKTNLHEAALNWMRSQGFFDDTKFGVSIENVYFEKTRADKVSRLATLNLDAFIDDLSEVFQEPHFPTSIQRILFSPNKANIINTDFATHSWCEIKDHLFGGHS